MAFWELVLEQWQQQSLGEIFAVILAIVYVWLASEESMWCWPAGFLSTALFAYIYWDVTLVFQMLLNLYYMAIAVWGFVTWRKQGTEKIRITKMNIQEHFLVLVLGMLITSIIYVIAREWLSYELVLLDITITVFALLVSYLTVIKRLENWIYWTIINVTSMVLLFDKQLYLTIILMLIYIALAVRGFIYWQHVYSVEKCNE